MDKFKRSMVPQTIRLSSAESELIVERGLIGIYIFQVLDKCDSDRLRMIGLNQRLCLVPTEPYRRYIINISEKYIGDNLNGRYILIAP